jgi:hypothetical protein
MTRLFDGMRCVYRARCPPSELWRMAKEYQERAAQLDDGKMPVIGEDPEF